MAALLLGVPDVRTCAQNAVAPAQVVAQWPEISGDNVEDLSILGNTLFAHQNWGMISVFDISAESRLRRVGTVEGTLPGQSRFMGAGGFALEYYGLGVRLLDVTRRVSPKEVSRIDGFANIVAVDWPIVYAADVSSHALKVYDFSDPQHPGEVSSIAFDGEYLAIKCAGDLLCAAGFNRPLDFYDISDRRHPVRSASLPYSGQRLALTERFAFLADWNLSVFDVSDKQNPRLAGEWTSELGGTGDIAVFGDVAWVGANDWTYILDVSDPTKIHELGRIPGAGMRFHAQRSAQIFCFMYPYIKVFDVTDPKTPKLKDQFLTVAPASQVELARTLAFLQQSFTETAVLDVSDPAAPRRVAGLPEAVALAVSDTNAFVVDTNQVLVRFDISNASAPSAIASLRLEAKPSAMAVSQGNLFVAISNEVRMIGFAEKDALAVEDLVQTEGVLMDVSPSVFGVIARSSDRLSFIALSDPHHMAIVATVTIPPFNAFGKAACAGNVAYVPESQSVGVWDISDPSRPVRVGSIQVQNLFSKAAVAGNRLYILDYDTILEFDILSPLAPMKVGDSRFFSPFSQQMAASGDYLYITALGGLRVIQVRGEMHPRLSIINEGEMIRVRSPRVGMVWSQSAVDWRQAQSGSFIPTREGQLELGQLFREATMPIQPNYGEGYFWLIN